MMTPAVAADLRQTAPGRARAWGATLASICLRDAAAVLGTVLTAAIVLLGLVGPLLATYDPVKVDMGQRLVPPGPAHWLGTDELGRDIGTRIAFGARFSIGAAAAIIGIATVAGLVVGGFAGYLGGRVDEVAMRVCDLVMAFPHLILAMAIAFALGPGLTSSVIALSAVWWPSYARLVRGMVLTLKEQLYVEAARAAGATTSLIVFRHILPHTGPAVTARLTGDIGFAIIASAGLSFIGLGAQQPVPEWGSMISSSRTFTMSAWWYGLFPGLAIFAAVLGISLLGDALQDALDPALRGKS